MTPIPISRRMTARLCIVPSGMEAGSTSCRSQERASPGCLQKEPCVPGFPLTASGSLTTRSPPMRMRHPSEPAAFTSYRPKAALRSGCGPDFPYARYPVWRPDSTSLLFEGADGHGAADWWVTPIDGGNPIRTHTFERMDRVSMHAAPERWDGTGFCFRRPRIEPPSLGTRPGAWDGWQASGTPRQITAGDGIDQTAAISPDGRISSVPCALPRHLDLAARRRSRQTSSGPAARHRRSCPEPNARGWNKHGKNGLRLQQDGYARYLGP